MVHDDASVKNVLLGTNCAFNKGGFQEKRCIEANIAVVRYTRLFNRSKMTSNVWQAASDNSLRLHRGQLCFLNATSNYGENERCPMRSENGAEIVHIK